MKSYPKRNLVLRVVAVLSLILILAGFRRPIFEIEGLGEFTLASLSEWGGRFLEIIGYCSLVAWAVLPMRLGLLLSGCLLGGISMLVVTLGKDTVDLAMMDENVSSAMELIQFEAGGKLTVVGLGLLFMTSLVTSCLRDKKIPDRMSVEDEEETKSVKLT